MDRAAKEAAKKAAKVAAKAERKKMLEKAMDHYQEGLGLADTLFNSAPRGVGDGGARIAARLRLVDARYNFGAVMQERRIDPDRACQTLVEVLEEALELPLPDGGGYEKQDYWPVPQIRACHMLNECGTPEDDDEKTHMRAVYIRCFDAAHEVIDRACSTSTNGLALGGMNRR